MRNAVNFEGKSYPDRRIKSLQAASSASLDMRTMEVDTVELTLDVAPVVMGLMTADMQPIYTADGYRLCVQESGGFSAWSQADPITLTRGGSQYAIWYPRQVKPLPGNYVSISGTSPLGRLTQMEHRGGIYAGTEAGGLIREICGDVPVYVSSVFEHVALYGYLPYVSPSGLTSAIKGSAKDNLLKVLFALNASLRVSAEGVLRVENLGTEVSSVLDRSRVYRENAAIQEDTPITSVTVLEHQYVTGTDATTLFEGTTTEGQVVIFREPCSNLTATGFSVLSSGANWAELSAGTGTLTGVPYIHITREVTRAVSQSDVENAVRIEDATLVGITNSGDVADRMAAYYANRTRILIDATVEFERPGDVVSAWDPVSKLLRQACIEKMSPVNLSQTMKAKLSLLVGFTPWQTVPFDDVHEIITTSGTYTFPADIASGTQVTVFLIGGGQGGTNGENGAAGTGSHTSGQLEPNKTYTSPAGIGGLGGVGGLKGEGGKVLRVSIVVDPSEPFTVTIGEGGAVGGSLGGDTLFGNYSSASGIASDDGYYDPISQISYGVSGVDGISGGNGGNGGSAGNKGADGGAAGAYAGGVGGAGYQYTSPYSGWKEFEGGGGGGGASDRAAGEDGASATSTAVGNGGAGSNGSPAPIAENYGDGGSGGNGGGGGGGAGAWSYTNDTTSGTYTYSASGGAAGAGTNGTAGKQGCVILIYRKPAT